MKITQKLKKDVLTRNLKKNEKFLFLRPGTRYKANMHQVDRRLMSMVTPVFNFAIIIQMFQVFKINIIDMS